MKISNVTEKLLVGICCTSIVWSCKPSNAGGGADCVSGVASVTSTFQGPRIKYTTRESHDTGGAIHITLDKGMNGAKYFDPELAEDGKALRCTAYFDFRFGITTESGKVTGNEGINTVVIDNVNYVPTMIWTANHCIREHLVDKVYLSFRNQNNVPVLIKSVEQMKAVKAELDKKYPEKKQLILDDYYEDFTFYAEADVNTFYEWLDLNPTHLANINKKKRDDLSNSEVFLQGPVKYLQEEVNEKLALGRPMCPSSVSAVPYKSNTYEDQKICFMNSELGIYSALVPVSYVDSKLVKETEEPITFASKDELQEVALTQMKRLADPKIEDYAKTISNFYSGLIQRRGLSQVLALQQMGDKNPTEEKKSIEELIASQFGFTGALSTRTERFNIFPSFSANYTASTYDENMQEYWIRAGEFFGDWSKFLDYLTVRPELLKLSTNVAIDSGFEFQSRELSYYFKSGSKSPGLVARQRGFVWFGESSDLTFKSGDSGAVLTFAGMVPLAVLSSVNDELRQAHQSINSYQPAHPHDKNTSLDEDDSDGPKEVLVSDEGIDIDPTSPNQTTSQPPSDGSGTSPIARNQNTSNQSETVTAADTPSDIPNITSRDRSGTVPRGGTDGIRQAGTGRQGSKQGVDPVDTRSISEVPPNCL